MKGYIRTGQSPNKPADTYDLDQYTASTIPISNIKGIVSSGPCRVNNQEN